MTMNEAYFKQRVKGRKSYGPTELLMCDLISAHGEFKRNAVLLFFPYGNCCDMTGAILYAKRIIPKVDQVQCYEDNVLINIYKMLDGEWKAYESRLPFRVESLQEHELAEF